MNTPTDKIRAALLHAYAELSHVDGSTLMFDKALSELDGCCIISIDEYNNPYVNGEKK